MNKNKDSTRYYSNKQETTVAKKLDGYLTSNSGAGKFSCGDVLLPHCDTLIECKTQMTNKESFSIKKEWLSKLKEECKSSRHSNYSLCFSFGPDEENYFIISESLMKYLCDKLKSDLE